LERSRLAELDSLAGAAQKRISKSISKTLLAYFKKLSDTDTPPSKEQLEQPYLPDIDPVFVQETETLIATALLLGMDHTARKVNAADGEIPPLPFEEAVSFMKGRIPMTKTEWNELESKLRFRSFTVARLAQVDYIEAARGRLISALEKGDGFASTWNDIRAIASEDGALNFKPGYWENVFRTNTQTAYTAGKLMQFKDNPPPAWQLLIIDDSRTSDICRGLIQGGKRSLAMPSDHPFWEKYGFPPYHYQCRTGLQAVYQSQIGTDVQVENPSIESLNKHFKPMKGFGGNSLDSGNYWMMTPGMFERGLRYGVINEFNMLDNIVADFDSVWKGYKREIVGKGWIDIHEKAIGYDEFKNNYEMAKKMTADGDHIKMLPIHRHKYWRNPDYLRNCSLWELESPNGSPSSINDAIREGQKQALNLILQLPKNVNREEVLWTLHKRFTFKKSPARVKNLIIYFGDQKEFWTAEQLRALVK
jgi:hypothetical protein